MISLSSSRSQEIEDSPVIFHSITPASQLARFVSTIFHLKDYQPEHAIERVVPDTLSSLVIELDGQERWVADNETHQPILQCRHSWVSGPHRNYFSISARPNTELLAVQFKVDGLYSLLRRPVEELTERIVDASELLGESIGQLRADLVKADSSEEKVRTAETWLLEQLDTALVPPPHIQQAIDKLQSDPSLETVTSCIANSGVSQKHAIHLFKKTHRVSAERAPADHSLLACPGQDAKWRTCRLGSVERRLRLLRPSAFHSRLQALFWIHSNRVPASRHRPCQFHSDRRSDEIVLRK